MGNFSDGYNKACDAFAEFITSPLGKVTRKTVFNTAMEGGRTLGKIISVAGAINDGHIPPNVHGRSLPGYGCEAIHDPDNILFNTIIALSPLDPITAAVASTTNEIAVNSPNSFQCVPKQPESEPKTAKAKSAYWQRGIGEEIGGKQYGFNDAFPQRTVEEWDKIAPPSRSLPVSESATSFGTPQRPSASELPSSIPQPHPTGQRSLDYGTPQTSQRPSSGFRSR